MEVKIQRTRMLLIVSLIFLINFGYGQSDAPGSSLLNPQRAKKLILSSCAHCHRGNNGELTGKILDELPKIAGKVVAPNITNTNSSAVAQWTEHQLKVFIKTGVKPDNSSSNIFMPRFPNISDSDLTAIIRYLKTTRLNSNDGNKDELVSRLSIPGKLVSKILKIQYEYLAEPLFTVDSLHQTEYGKYLVDDVLHCFACHSKSPARLNFKIPQNSKGYLAGGTSFKDLNGKKVLSSNLTFDVRSGIGEYTQEEFKRMMKYGRKKNGKQARHPMMPYSALSKNDIESIYEYLKTVPPAFNKKLVH